MKLPLYLVDSPAPALEEVASRFPPSLPFLHWWTEIVLRHLHPSFPGGPTKQIQGRPPSRARVRSYRVGPR